MGRVGSVLLELPGARRKPWTRSPRACWALAAVAVAVTGIASLALYVDHYGVSRRMPPAGWAEVIVVLGAGVNRRGLPGDSLRARTLHAVELYRQGIAPRLLFTGGVGNHPPAESVAAGRLAESQGVPPRDIFREEKSTSTRENARFAAEVCREHGWKRVLLVSDPYHLLRAEREFAREGLEVRSSGATNAVMHQEGTRRAWGAFRDAVLLIRDTVLP